MNAAWKTVRVFISSTFRDMQAERDWLVRFVFPKLREELLKHRIHFIDVDLRWGVTSDENALGVCREVIDHCHPRFMCILGGRYGWMPDGKDKSITADEVHYGVLDREAAERGRAFFYFRKDEDTLAIPDEDARSGGYREFAQTDEIERYGLAKAETMAKERANKLAALKQSIIDAKLPVHHYEAKWSEAEKRMIGLEKFGVRVYDDLLQSLKSDPELAAHFTTDSSVQPDEFADERDQMESFIEERVDQYILGSREPLMNDLLAFASTDGSPNILILTGEPGSGKSALVAKFCRSLSPSFDLPVSSPPSLLVSHFVGASTGSTDLRRTLRRLCHELAKVAGNTEPLPLDIKELITHFQKLLNAAGENKRIILVFDALNQFDATDGAHWMNWLPRELPPNVRIVASVIAPAEGEKEHQTLAILRNRNDAHVEALKPLDETDTQSIIEGYLKRYSKRLSPKQTAALKAKPASNLPLYVLTALEELRTLGTYEEITARIRTLPGDARALFGWILTERLARDPGFRDREGRPCGAALIEKFAACLGVSRHGLSPAELTALLDPGDPLGNVAALLRLVRPYLMRRGELLDFYHGQFREAADHVFLHSDRQRCEAHQHLCKYFRPKADPREDRTWLGSEPRSLGEISFHLTCAAVADGNWDAAVELLCDLRFVEARCRVGQIFELIADYKLAQENLPELQAALKQEREIRSRATHWTTDIIAYAKAWDERRNRLARDEQEIESEPVLPVPLETCRVWTADEIQADSTRVTTSPTRLDRLEAFAAFVRSQCYPLLEHAARTGFTFQQAFSSSPSGPVHEAAALIVAGWQGPHLLRRWPERTQYNAHPALLRTLEGHGNVVLTVSITPDGRRAVSGGWDRTLRVWDLETGQCVRVLDGHGNHVTNVSMTPDGHRAVSASYDGTLRVWDLEAGACLRILEGHRGIVWCAALTPDGCRAVSGSSDKTVRVWDLETGECIRTLEDHRAPGWERDWIKCVSLTPDGRRAISGEGTRLRLWDVDSGTCLLTMCGQHGIALSVCMSPDGHLAVSGSHLDGAIQVWNLETGKCLRTLKGHRDQVQTVDLTSDGRRVISGAGSDGQNGISRDNSVKVWDLETGECVCTLEAHSTAVCGVSVTRDGRRAVSVSYDKTLRVWDLTTGAGLQIFPQHSNEVVGVNVTPDGHRALSCSQDQTVRVWDLVTGVCLHTLQGHTYRVECVGMTPDGRCGISGSLDRTVRAWDLESGKCLLILKGHNDRVHCVSVTPDFHYAISGSGDRTVRVWDLRTGACLRVLEGHNDWVRGVKISVTPAGRYVISACQGRKFRVWDLETGACLRTIEGHSYMVDSVTSDLRRAVSADYDQPLRVWDLVTGSCLHTLEGHTAPLNFVSVTQDGRYAISGSQDKTLRVWDLDTGACVSVFATGLRISALALSASGQIGVAGTTEGRVLAFDLRGFHDISDCLTD